MSLNKIILIVVSFFTAFACAEAQKVVLLPAATNARFSSSDSFKFSDRTKIATDKFAPQVAAFVDILEKWESIKVQTVNKYSKGQIFITIVPEAQIDTAGYTIEIEKDRIIVEANSNSGAGNAFSTLLQMLVNGRKADGYISIPTGKILDRPKFSWRGFMLDESRHFFGKTEVKKILDQMYLFKLNRFHWHLTDEPGWRLEIQKYPLLASIGGKGDFSDSTKPSQYYTQDDIKDIVTYATARNITVIPEIDMPGHATAANKAYPEYSGGGSLKHPDFTFNPGNENVYIYLTNILKETQELFPSNIVHLGGDEVSFGNEKWSQDSAIINLREKHNLTDNNDVERYFLRRMADSVGKQGVTVMGWDEMTDVNLPKDSTILIWWRHEKIAQLQLALSKGYHVVLSPRIPFYFDFVQDERDKVGRRWGKRFGTYSDVLNFPPDSLVASRYKAQILGIQANLWTETVKSRERLEYLIFPRLVAVAYAAWSSKAVDVAEFKAKVQAYFPLWKKLGIHYFDLVNPDNTPEITDKAAAVNYLDNK